MANKQLFVPFCVLQNKSIFTNTKDEYWDEKNFILGSLTIKGGSYNSIDKLKDEHGISVAPSVQYLGTEVKQPYVWSLTNISPRFDENKALSPPTKMCDIWGDTSVDPDVTWYYPASSTNPMEVEVDKKAGYDFVGWWFADEGIFYSQYNKRYETNPCLAIFPSSYDFNGYAKILDEKKGRIQLKYAWRLWEISSVGSLIYCYPLVPVLKYIRRTITFNQLDGSSEYTRTYEGAGSISLPVASRAGYTFAGWYSNSSFSNSSFVGKGGETYTCDENTTLYAKWIPYVTVGFNPNGGSVSTASKSVEFEKYYGELPTATRSGYKFLGWFTQANGGIQIKMDSLVETTKDHFLYAHWKGVGLTVKKVDLESENELKDVGELHLYSSENAFASPFGTETDGRITVEGSGEYTYRITCSLKDEGEDFFWKPVGVLSGGAYHETLDKTYSPGNNYEEKFYLQRKSFHSVSFTYNSEHGEVSVIEPSEADYDGKYVEGRDILISVTAFHGRVFKSGTVINKNTGKAEATFDELTDGKLKIENISFDMEIYVLFDKETYSVSANVSEASSSAISEITMKVDGKTASAAEYGSLVEVSVKVNEGFGFDGWYVGVEKVSSNMTYTFTVEADVSLEAKASVSVDISVRYVDNRDDKTSSVLESCSIIANGKIVDGPFDVILGDSYTYTVSLGKLYAEGNESWNLNAWFDAQNILQSNMGISGSITPLSSQSFVVEVSCLPILNTLSFKFFDEGNDTAIEAQSDFVEFFPSPKRVYVSSEGFLCAEYQGTTQVSVKFTESFFFQQETELIYSYAQSGDKIYSFDTIDVISNSDIEFNVYYGSEGDASISVNFVVGNNWTMGKLALNEFYSEQDSLPLNVVTEKKSYVRLVAEPKNGYMFVGWFLNKSGLGTPFSTNASYDLRVTSNKEIYAKFSRDFNALYKWEGASDGKMMEWRSKTYEAERPFCPSACRVDTLGYPLNVLEVGMFSAPQSSAVSKIVLSNIKTQQSRRLPVSRAERFMQISVRNNHEVDAIIVGTSMGGLR